ncbi:unnamed protein product [Effrenium voratum]|uniref:Uncharacterized protein n=1 Tax=Effrenium voratum TaxID=2562239 RepID=A0AA36MX25_9DINO|nr:unnamed protein product [Effrenium voratum]
MAAVQAIPEKHVPAVEAASTDDSDSDLPELYDATSDSGSDQVQAQAFPEKEVEAKEVQELLRRYVAKFGESRDGEVQGYNRRAFPWYSGESFNEKGEIDIREIQAVLSKPKTEKRQAKLWDVDSEGEQVTLCAHCLLPVGEVSYSGAHGKATSLHGECAAQIMLQDMKDKDAKRVSEEVEKKQKSRAEHGIGWTVAQVPRNVATAAKLGCTPAPQGLVCLAWDQAQCRVSVQATADPAAAVNLEYLALALKVRFHACREPLFSLDPVNPAGGPEKPRREHSMPVLGMMSVFDWSEADNVKGGWTGREWFVVNKAEVKLSPDGTLIPCVKMGVEARTQVCRNGGLEDSAITSKNHPLRKFAENFSKNFDLIAERKSVIFELRELAKASAMAKFLVDSGTSVPQEWWQLADDLVKSAKPGDKNIPQLWNMRGQSRIQVRDGKLVNSQTGQCYLTSVYGGIEFGLDRFELAQRHTLRPVGAGGSTMVGGLQGMQLGPTARPGFAPPRFQLTQRPAAPAPGAEQPQGVDLNLDAFDLSQPEKFAEGAGCCSAPLGSLEARVPLGLAFLRGMQSKAFKAEDRSLLQSLFKEQLADRLEGDAFVPPDPDMKYISKLRALISEEDVLRQKRKAQFCDAAFIAEQPGALFPRHWTSNFQLEQEGLSTKTVKKALRSGLVQLSVDPKFQRHVAEVVLPEMAPAFEKSVEDGSSFRIYRCGTLEVRTIQEVSGPENIMAVFSLRGAAWTATQGRMEAPESEKVVQVKMYVEAVDMIGDLTRSIQGRAAEPSEQLDAPWRSQTLEHCHYFVVLQTDKGTVLVTEKLRDGSVRMTDAENAEERISLARLLYTHSCKEAAVALKEVRVFQAASARATAQGAKASDAKLYARNLFKLASGKAWLVRKSKGAGAGGGWMCPGGKGRRAEVPVPAVLASERRTYSSKVQYGTP